MLDDCKKIVLYIFDFIDNNTNIETTKIKERHDKIIFSHRIRIR